MHFGENQLSPGSLGISPLTAAHPRLLQQTSVRPSTSVFRPLRPGHGEITRFRVDPARLRRPFGLAFAAAPPVPGLTPPRWTTRRLILQKARRHSTRLPGPSSDRPGAHGFRLSFTPLAGVLFTVPSRYWFPIGRRRYSALGRGRPRFNPDSACRGLLTIPGHQDPAVVAYGALTLCDAPFQRASADRRVPGEAAAAPSTRLVQPRGGIAGRLCRRPGLGSSPFARRYWGNPLCSSRYQDVSGPAVPFRLAPDARACPARVAPFGHLRIPGRQRLPGAFRRVAASFLGRQRLGIPRAPFVRSPTEFRLAAHPPNGAGPARASRRRVASFPANAHPSRSVGRMRPRLPGPTLRATSGAPATSLAGCPTTRLAIGQKVLGEIAVITFNHCVQCARTARRERLRLARGPFRPRPRNPAGRAWRIVKVLLAWGYVPNGDDPWTGGVEPRGFEPRTSAVQGRRSPG